MLPPDESAFTGHLSFRLTLYRKFILFHSIPFHSGEMMLYFNTAAATEKPVRTAAEKKRKEPNGPAGL